MLLTFLYKIDILLTSFINSLTAKGARFPAPSLAATGSGLALRLRARRGGRAPSLLYARYKTLPPRRISLILSPPLQRVGRHAAPCVGLCLILGHSSPIVVSRPCTKHISRRLGDGSLASRPALSHPAFGMNGRSAPSHSLSRGFTALVQPSAGAKRRPRLVRLSPSTIIPSPPSPIIV